MWTSNDDFRLYVRGNYSELYEKSNIADTTQVPVYEGQPTRVDFSSISGYEHLEFSENYYSWLGTRPPMPNGIPQGWRLIRVPVSTIERNPSQKIHGISFEFIFPSVPSNRILLDEIRLVSYE